jgi:hypothetical protein
MSSPGDPSAVMPNALHVLLLDLDRTVGWKLDLMREMVEASRRIANLARSVEAALWLVPQPLRADYRRRLDASLARDAIGTGAAPPKDRVTLLHEFLAARGPAKVTSKEVLRHLRANAHPADAKAVARLMSAKCQQGLLTRTGRGSYRIERTHPVLARLQHHAEDSPPGM